MSCLKALTQLKEAGNCWKLATATGTETGPILGAGLWIHIHFLRIRIQLFFSMRIRIQQVFYKCGPVSGSNLTKLVKITL